MAKVDMACLASRTIEMAEKLNRLVEAVNKIIQYLEEHKLDWPPVGIERVSRFSTDFWHFETD